MEWRDEAIHLTSRLHGEKSVIIDVFTKEHGRHSGLVRAGTSRKYAPLLQSGTHLSVIWSARLEEHLGIYSVDLIASRSTLLDNRLQTEALATICALLHFALPERQALTNLYIRTQELLTLLEENDDWPIAYALWELALLEELGFGLDLSSCAGTGEKSELIYISPKSGQAVSRTAGAPYSDRLLSLPQFFLDPSQTASKSDIHQALTTTGFFLMRRIAAHLGNRPLPMARDRLLNGLKRYG